MIVRPFGPTELEALLKEHAPGGVMHWCVVCRGQGGLFYRLLATCVQQQAQLEDLNNRLSDTSRMTKRGAAHVESVNAALQVERDRYAGALREIATADYRGNRSSESVLAKNALEQAL